MFVHIFKRREEWFAFHPITMGVADLSAAEAQCLADLLRGHSAEDCRALAIRDGFWNMMPDTLAARLRALEFFDGQTEEANPENHRSIEVVLNVAQACNLDCTYCFSDNTSKAIMEQSTAFSAIEDAFDRYPQIDEFRLSFFGGEPTLNLPLIEAAVRHHHRLCSERGVCPDYFITTNAVSLSEEALALFDEFGFEVQVSIDGSKNTHDRYRVDHQGRGSHDRVVATLQELRKRDGIRLSTSSVITKSNNAVATHDILESLEPFHMKLDMVYEFQDLGGGDFASTEASFSKVMGMDFDEIGDRFVDRVTRYQRPAEYNFRQSVILLSARKTKSRFCPAADTRIGVGADGHYYPCGASASLKENVLGEASQGIDPRAVLRFEERLEVGDVEPCRSCWARPLCLGGCPLTIRSLPNRLHCSTRKHLAEISIRVFSEIRERDPMSFLVLTENPAGKALATFFQG